MTPPKKTKKTPVETPSWVTAMPRNNYYLGLRKDTNQKWLVEKIWLNDASELVIERLYEPCGQMTAINVFKRAAARMWRRGGQVS